MSGENSIKVSLDSMRSDSRVWSTAAADLQGPLSSISTLELTGGEMSFFATEKGLDATYNEARSAVEEMIRKAEEYFRKISNNLESAAKQYENDDADASDRVEKAAQGF